jgi:hydroxypyruvate reductase
VRQLAETLLERVSADAFMRTALTEESKPNRPIFIISLGKAAGAMGKETAFWLGASFAGGFATGHNSQALTGLEEKWQTHIGGHPRPNEQSVIAGTSLQAWIETLPQNASVWACLSGGASAIIEVPKPGSSLLDLQSCLYRSFTEGWSIERLNGERQKHSELKGGGLAKILGSRLERVFCLSDVEPGRLDVLGSGPFWTESVKVLHKVIADRNSLVPLIESAVREQGLTPVNLGSFTMDLEEWAATHLKPAINHAEPDTLGYWVGEPTLRLGENPPPGGRCHEAAFRARLLLKPNQAFAAFGTDGLDGTSGGAGAWVSSDQPLPVAPSLTLKRHDSLAWCKEVYASIPEKATASNLNDIALLNTQ